MRRRSVLLGLGTAAAGSGIAFGSGAFTQVQAERSITIGVSTDSNALIKLNPNDNIQSVYETETGQLAVNSNELASEDKGFNVGSTVQIGATTEPFGDEVKTSNPAFEITNKFDDNSGQDGSNFDGTVDIGVDLGNVVPSEENQINSLELIITYNTTSKTVTAGDRRVLTGLEPDDSVAVAIRVETSNSEGEFNVGDAITIQAGSDLTASDFPNEGTAPMGVIENQQTGERFSDIQTAVDTANPNETLLIGPGTFTQSGTLDINTEGLTLRTSAGADKTVINDDGSIDDSSNPDPEFALIKTTAPNTTVRGLTIEPSTATQLGIQLGAEGSSAIDNIIDDPNNNDDRDPGSGGISTEDTDAGGLSIKNNEINNAPIAHKANGSVEIVGNDINGDLSDPEENETNMFFSFTNPDVTVTMKDNNFEDATVADGDPKIKFVNSGTIVNGESDQSGIQSTVAAENAGISDSSDDVLFQDQ